MEDKELCDCDFQILFLFSLFLLPLIYYISSLISDWKSRKLCLSKHSLLSSSSLKFGEFLVMSLNSMKSKLPFVDKEVGAKEDEERKYNRDITGY